MIGRREFIALMGGAAAAWPLAARGQEREKVRRIGVMASLAADDRVAQIRNGAFLQGLQQAGWNVGRNVSIEAGIGEAARRHAAELVALAPDISSPEVARPQHRWCRSPRPSPWCSSTPPTRSDRAWSAAWPSRAATPPVLLNSNMASLENGWSFSSRLRRPRRARPWHAMRPLPPGSASGRRSSRSRRYWACR